MRFLAPCVLLACGLHACGGTPPGTATATVDADGGPAAPGDAGPPADAGPLADAGPSADAGTSGLPGLDDYIPPQMAAIHTPGMAAAIVKGDQLVWSHGYGFANVAKQVPVTTATLFHLASVSKTVTSVAVMQLVEGGLSLDGDVSENVGFTIQNPSFASTAITLRMLLTHVSSLLDNSILFTLVSENVPTSITLEQFVRGYFIPGGAYYDATQDFDTHPPATTWNYCNACVTLAGYHVQALSNTAFDDYCKAHIFTPLGMTESSYRLASLDPSHIAMQYDSNGTTEIGNDDYPDFPDGELRTSVDQYARFLLMFMNGGTYAGATILRPETVTEMERVQYPSVDPDQGITWYYQTREPGRILGHEGAVTGVTTRIGFNPTTHVGVVLLSNGNAALNSQQTANAFDAIFDHIFDVAQAL
jgi:CubicO group peptidase (beta-lactamase class C family)